VTALRTVEPDAVSTVITKTSKTLNKANEICWFLDKIQEDTTLEKSVAISFSKGCTTFKEQGNQTQVYLSIFSVK